MTCCHSGVNNPYWVRDKNSSASGNSSGDHRLDSCEPLRCTGAADGRTLEKGTGPLIPWIMNLSADDSETVGAGP